MKAKLIATAAVLSLTNLSAIPREFHPDHPPQTRAFDLGGGLLSPRIEAAKEYRQRDFSHLKGMDGFSDKALETHFKLYGGYVKNTNLLLDRFDQMRRNDEMTGPYFAELRRRFGWEFSGMRLHELYFSNLGGRSGLNRDSELYQVIERDFGSFSSWEQDFRKTGAMRGIGWVILYRDPISGRLINTWINEHDIGHLPGGDPLLVMDVWEHAYMVDYNIKRGDYIDAFIRNIDWRVVEERYRDEG